jgi:hypothetical protein
MKGFRKFFLNNQVPKLKGHYHEKTSLISICRLPLASNKVRNLKKVPMVPQEVKNFEQIV